LFADQAKAGADRFLLIVLLALSPSLCLRGPLIHRMEAAAPRNHNYKITNREFVMILELEPVTTFPAVPLIHDAAQGRIPWTQAAEAIARFSNVTRVTLERLKPQEASDRAAGDAKLFASRSFIQRWRLIHGEAPPVIETMQAPGKVYTLAPFTQNAEGEKALVHALQDTRHLGLGIDSPEGFFVLLIEGSPPASSVDHACQSIVHCAYELGRAAETEGLVRRAQQDLVLHMLESGGTAAFVLDSDGWVKAKNICAQKLIGEILHFETAPAVEKTATDADRIGLSNILPLHKVRTRQMSIVTPAGRRVMTYAVPWKHNNSIFGSEDELLVGWDMRADAAMIGRLGEKASEPVAFALRETFGLTRMESILATRLIGSDLRTAATESGMAYETARTHLKSMFARMNIGSQGELTGLLSRFAYHERLRAMLAAI
jgi:DNA-binding CsgD family transcriptional regulator